MHHVTCQDLLTYQLSCGKWNSLTLPNFHPNLQLPLCSPSLLKASYLRSRPSWKSGRCYHFFFCPRKLLPTLTSYWVFVRLKQGTMSRSAQHNVRQAVVRKEIYFFVSPCAIFALSTALSPTTTKPPKQQTFLSNAFLLVIYSFPHGLPKASALLVKLYTWKNWYIGHSSFTRQV